MISSLSLRLYLRVWPRCSTESAYGRLEPHSKNDLNAAMTLHNQNGWVESWQHWTSAHVLDQTLHRIEAWSEGQQLKVLIRLNHLCIRLHQQNLNPTMQWQPTPNFCKPESKSSTYIVKRMGERTLPWRTPLETWNGSESVQFHLTLSDWSKTE